MLALIEADVGTTKASDEVILGRPWVKTSWSFELTMVAPDVMLLGGGIGAGGGGGGGRVGPGGDTERMGESSSVNKSRMLSSRDGSSLVPRSFENPDATSSSCCTGCLGSKGRKNLFSEPSLPPEVTILVLLDMTTEACGVAEAIEVVRRPFEVATILGVIDLKAVEVVVDADA